MSKNSCIDEKDPRISDLPDVIRTIACFSGTRTGFVFNSTCTQFRKLFRSLKLTEEGSERFIFEPELRNRIQARLNSPVRNIHIRGSAHSLTQALIDALKNIESLTWLELNFAGPECSDISAISGLTNLKSLNLTDTQDTDISAISGLPNLTRLKMPKVVKQFPAMN